ncbi:hypothetical protein FVEG_16896 [Fusarium verticillioides 7600]|uniref:Uncharacterized protein n=1 Tax=Gibberella moniliformis (strain M3125 / FGSC 7600) TaxID=334819 RepID=W7MKR5_GIBM7|nr:hypothetical protein FVEG_16896 [Fusarium verticillioides 7600]EWG51998.1 hypothetical protein FVEG_16896 [Fusarium verticillioides 7600]
MVHINLAYSAPINPSAHEFVAPILETEILSEEQTELGTRVTRQVVFDKEARGSNDNVVKEVVYEFAPTRVDFYHPDGSKIFNIVSVDKEESEQAKELRDQYIKGTVEGTIATIRKLVKEGEL